MSISIIILLHAILQDRYADQRSKPAIDNMQDWFLISAAINNGYTELEFSRNFTTCDNESKDLDILVSLWKYESNTKLLFYFPFLLYSLTLLV